MPMLQRLYSERILRSCLLLTNQQTKRYSISRNLNNEKKTTQRQRIFSGIQPTGVPHIGNYIGAIKDWVSLQRPGDDGIILSIVDLHSITLPQNPDTLRSNIFSMAVSLLACGIDPEKTILFQQSQVSEHAELSWLLGCLTTMPRLQHLPQWKEKSETLKETPLGLFTYPVLQAADILLYRATHVPVGDDQLQQIELARDLAKSFNKKFGYLFPQPQPMTGSINRIKNLRNPSKKMSKSNPDPKTRIDLTDSPEQIRNKIKKAVTDFTPTITYDPIERPGVSNLVDLHCSMTDLFPEDVVEDPNVMVMDTLQYKLHVADVVIEHLSPIQKEMERLNKDPQYVYDILKTGQSKAKEIASVNYVKAKQLMGLL